MSSSVFYQMVKTDASLIAGLPEPPETFEQRDIDALDPQTVMRLAARDVLVREERVEGENRSRWSVHPEAYRIAQDYLEESDVFPCCGSTGFVNREGDLFCCDCGAPVDRETARRVVA